MKRIVLVAASALLATPLAFAQAKNFEGFSLALIADSSRSTAEVVGTASDSSTVGGLGLEAQYSIPMGNQFVLGLGVNYRNGSRSAGTVGGTNFSIKDAAAFDIVPGFALSDSMLVYGKVSGLSASAIGNTGGTESSESISGYGYGLGLRSFIDKNMFFQVGYDANTYDNKTKAGVTYKNSANVFSLGFGYKF